MTARDAASTGGPRFSVVIPTRDRAQTLRFALETCLEQDFDDYEVVVCDNCGSPATKAVVDSFASPRIVYHRSPTPLCLRDNWNLAYGLTRGRYLTFIGDDDGLMPYALSQLDALIRRCGVEAVRWDTAVYSWPCIARSDLADYLLVPVSKTMRALEGRQTIRDVLAGRLPAPVLPNVYHGLVARDVLETIRNRTGNVFASCHSDTYTSFAVAYFVDRYLSLTAPMSVAGFSGSSNNIAFHFLRGKHANTHRQRAENAAAELKLHPWVPDLPTGFVAIADSFLLAKQDLFANDSSLEIDRKFLAQTLLENLPIDDLGEWAGAVAEIRKSLSDDPDLVAWFDEASKNEKPEVRPLDSYRCPRAGLQGRYLHLDASDYGVEDVSSAVRLAASVFGHGREPMVLEVSETPDMEGSRLDQLAKKIDIWFRLFRWRLRRGRFRPRRFAEPRMAEG